MNLGAVSDEVSTAIGNRVPPADADQGYSWLLGSISIALDELSSEELARQALIEFAVFGFLLLRFSHSDTQSSDLFLDVANAAQAHTRYLPPSDAISTPALYARLLGYLSEALVRRTGGVEREAEYEWIVDAIALAEIAVALYDEKTGA